MWWDGHMNGWAWVWGMFMMIGFWALIAWVVVTLVRTNAGRPDRSGYDSSSRSGPTPEEVLANRFARGEIDTDEYQDRLAALREGHVSC